MQNLVPTGVAFALLSIGCAAGTVPDVTVPDASSLDATPPDVSIADTSSDATPVDAAPDARVHTPGHLGLGVFYQPPATETTDARYADIAHFGIDLVVAINTDGTVATNSAMATACAHNGIGLVVRDSRFGGAPPSLTDIDAVVAAYSGMAGLAGYYVRDEPSGSELPGYAADYIHLVMRDAVHTANYLNLLPTYAGESSFIVPRPAAVSQTGATDGTYVTPTTPLSQTFRTAATQTAIDAIEINADAGQWSSTEALTLSLYDGSTLLASRTLTASNNANFPQFVLESAVLPSHAYRWELTHGGGGDASVGWVTHSSSDTYTDGAASVGTVAQPYDFYFRLYAGPADIREGAQRTTGSGDFVTPATPMGQTFAVPADAAYPLRSFEMNIDPGTWSSAETLTLTIWDSPSRHLVLGRASLSGSNNGYYPRFDLDAHLTAGHTYYAELTHNGGGDGSVGWVVHSAADANPATQGYRSGGAQTWDLYFRAFYGLGLYDTYVETWAAGSNAWQIVYDNYPFAIGGDSTNYFWNMALVRDRAVAHHIPFWGYLQSIAWTGMRAPSAAELRWNAFATLAFGAAGLYYFTYWDPVFDGATHFSNAVVNADGSHGALYAPGAALNAEIHALGGILGGAQNDGVYVSGPDVPAGLSQLPPDAPVRATTMASPWLLGFFTLDDGRRAVLIVNLDHDAQHSGTFNWQPAPAVLNEVSHTSGAPMAASGYTLPAGTIAIDVAAGDGRLFVWGP